MDEELNENVAVDLPISDDVGIQEGSNPRFITIFAFVGPFVRGRQCWELHCTPQQPGH